MDSLIKRDDDGLHIIEEHRRSIIGEYRFSLDRREGKAATLVTIGWFKTREAAEGAKWAETHERREYKRLKTKYEG
jgi:hypothetical protein